MRKYALLSIGLCLLCTQLDAQVAIATARELALISRGVAKSVRKGNPLYIPGKSFVGRTGLYPFQVTRVLKRRVAKTREAARIAQLNLTREGHQSFEPVRRMRQYSENIKPITEPVSYVRTRKQARLYLTAQENRFYLQERHRFSQQILPKLKANLPRLRQAAAQVPQPENPAEFLAQAIPAEVNTLAIGEVHMFESVKSFIVDFLPPLRKARPDQEIIILTELLPKGIEYPSRKYNRIDYQANMIWLTARQNDIRVIGLETKEVHLNAAAPKHEKPNFNVDNPQGLSHDISFFASANGMKWRNEQFMETIQKYRAEHPNALLVIYTGKMHVEYNAPFSLTSKLDPQKTFVLSVLPSKSEVAEQFPLLGEKLTNFLWQPFSEIEGGMEGFDQPLLYWQDPQLARIAGANAYIRTEVTIPLAIRALMEGMLQ